MNNAIVTAVNIIATTVNTPTAFHNLPILIPANINNEIDIFNIDSEKVFIALASICNDILSNIPDTESAIIANGFFSATTIHPIFNAIDTAAPITTANGVRIDNNITTFLSIFNVPCIALVIRLPKSVNIFPVTSKTLPTKRTKLFKIVNNPFKKVPSP